MPDKPKTALEVGNDLAAIFGEEIKEEQYFEEWCRIGFFLSDRKKVLKQLRVLSAEILTEVLERDRDARMKNTSGLFKGAQSWVLKNTDIGSDREKLKKEHYNYHKNRTEHYGELNKDRLPGKNYEQLSPQAQSSYQEKLFSDYYQSDDVLKKIHGKVLDSCLRSSEQKHGFAAGRAYYHGFVKPKEFMQEIADKKQWKDPGALPVHGEHTHRIQWYCIGKELYAEDSKSTAKAYKSIGKSFPKYSYSKEDAVLKKSGTQITLTLWDALCDRTCIKQVAFDTEAFQTFDADGENFGEDFRSPENLNMLLTDQSNLTLTQDEFGEDELLLLLHASLQGRFFKRVYTAADGLRIDSHEYLSKKKFKVPYSQLSGENAKIIDDLVMQDPPIWSM